MDTAGVKQISKSVILFFLALAQFMVVLDTSIVNIALPSLQRTLHLGTSNLQWVVTAYTLLFGGFLLLGGRAADLFGRRRVFLSGVAGFSLASLLVGLSQNSGEIIILRAIQGLSAAFMSPAALSIVLNTFSEGKERNRALGIWGGIGAGGAAAGQLIGGALTQYLGWRWNFFVNVPVGLIVAFGVLRYVPHHKSELSHRSLDLRGALLSTTGLMLLVFALVKAPDYGWGALSTDGMLAGAVALLAGFAFNEWRVRHPLVPLGIFLKGNVAGANLTQLPITASLYAMFFFLSLYIQQILHYLPVHAGLSFLPITIVAGGTAALTGNFIINKVGYKPILITAPIVMAVGLILLGHIPVDGTYYRNVFPGLALMAAGLGLSFVSLTVAATTGISHREAGLASGLINTSQQVGGALGLAVLTGVASHKMTEVLAGQSHPGPLAVANASVQGFHSAFFTGIIFTAIAAASALLLIKQPKNKKISKIGLGTEAEASPAPA
jgi:EmrB/QacA subfamily drug resistance transporter